MKNIELIYEQGPFGDETSAYSLEFEKGTTVRDVIDFALSKNGDWGYVWVIEGKSFSINNPRLEYRYGHIVVDNIPENIKKKKVKNGSADGGWSRMDYNLHV